MSDLGVSPAASVEPIAVLTGIHKRFGGVHALRGVDLTLDRQEIHALLGQNGAGKSTLIKILTGAVIPDAGKVEIDGTSRRFREPAEARAAGISVVYQDNQLFPNLSVAENVLAGRPPVRSWWALHTRDRRKAIEVASALLQRVGVDLDPRQPVSSLAPTERKMVEVARALAENARILVLDEPTAALDPRGTEEIVTVVRRLCAQGVAILYVSHKLDEVLSLCHRVTALRDGRVLSVHATTELDLAALVRILAGGELRSAGDAPAAVGDPLLSVEAVSTETLRPTTVAFRSRQLTALTGLVGSGADTVARVAAAAERYEAGTVAIAGQHVAPGDRRQAVKLGIAFVPENRATDGIFPDLSIEKNIALSSLAGVSRRGALSRRLMRRQARQYIERLDIRPPTPTLAAGKLSGGNQQKVLLARWLASGATVLITEEPTHGLDVAAKAEIHEVLRQFAAAGGSVVIVSLDIAEYLGLPTDVAVFRAGELVATLPGNATPSEIQSVAVVGAGSEAAP
jgi:ABC-type sugar transport system ATPase subunit